MAAYLSMPVEMPCGELHNFASSLRGNPASPPLFLLAPGIARISNAGGREHLENNRKK
jgi:hypothetical protein